MSKAQIHYFTLTDEQTRDEKLQFFSQTRFKDIPFDHVQPDKNNNWINLADNDFESLLPLADKAVKAGKSKEALFELFSLGVVTARDEWVYDFDEKNIKRKVDFLIDVYNKDLLMKVGKDVAEIKNNVNYSIKWTRAVKNDLAKGVNYKFSKKWIIDSFYRPFVRKKLYFSKELIEMPSLQKEVYGINLEKENICLGFIGNNTVVPFTIFAFNHINDYNSLSNAANGNKTLPFYRYDAGGNRIENITDWGLNQFCKHYKAKPIIQEKEVSELETTSYESKKGGLTYPDFEQPHLKDNTRHELHEPQIEYGLSISKEDIFHYVYAVLHNPAYRKKYELNLKREFPRIPFYEDFKKWSEWGKTLMDLHINYETVKPFPLKTIKANDVENPKCKLKADKESGAIFLDENTTLTEIPKEAWDYKLGNRSALEWILDQYKEKKPTDPTILEKFNTYKFADYKTQVIDLLKRVCTVSVQTMEIVNAMNEVTDPIAAKN